MTPRTMRLSALLRESQVPTLGPLGADPEIVGAAVDSRSIEPGNLFVAIRGQTSDGVRFVPDAVRRGARAVVAASARPQDLDAGVGWIQVAEPRLVAGPLARECYGRPDEALTVAGITGTNGKTTVTYLLDAIAHAAGRRTGRIGTVGATFEGHRRELTRTTPEAPDLYRLLDEMRDDGVELVAMEVSSHALALSRVEGLRFDLAAFLNLSVDHLDFHGDEDAYFEAKSRLFEMLTSESRAVIPDDSPFGPRLRERCRADVLTFGRTAAADVRLRDEHCGLGGSSATLETPLGRLPIRTFLLGRYNLTNIAAAAACAVGLGLPSEAIPQGVLALEGVPGRMERVDRGQPFTVIVDYAHTPAALAELLSWLREVTRGALHVVFGCGGARDVTKRPQMGRVAAELADRVVLTSDNPRDEEPQQILEQIRAGVLEVPGGADRCHRIEDRRDAIHAALEGTREGDVVVIAGKGHETGQVIGRQTNPFDDRCVAGDALETLGWRGSGVADD